MSNPIRKRLGELAGNLGEIETSVRDAVAEAVGATLSRLARDAVDALLGREKCLPAPPYRGEPHRYDSYANDDPWRRDDPWREDDPWSDDHERARAAGDSSPGCDRQAGAVAAGLAASGWWLRRGTPAGALLVGLATLAVLAGRDHGIGSRLAEAASRVLGLRSAAGN